MFYKKRRRRRSKPSKKELKKLATMGDENAYYEIHKEPQSLFDEYPNEDE